MKSCIFLFLLVSVIACQRQDDLDFALTLADENRTELRKVLNYFKDDTLHIITDIPTRLCTTVYTNNTNKYRYMRYKGPGTILSGKEICNSAGKKYAQADSLLYSISKNSLLYLKNHPRGKDE